MAQPYDWAVNRLKLTRAQNELSKGGKEVNEEEVKALYISYGGLVDDNADEAPKKAPKSK